MKRTNALITGIQFVQPLVLDPALMRLPETERVVFTYQRIEWVWTDGGASASDDWVAQTARSRARRTEA